MSDREMREDREVFWRGHVVAWRAEGGTQVAYCHRHGLVAHRLSYWVRRLGEGTKETTALSFVPAVPLAPESPYPVGPVALKLHHPHGWQLEFDRLPPPAWLAQLWGAQA